jgi:hypothetical protein
MNYFGTHFSSRDCGYYDAPLFVQSRSVSSRPRPSPMATVICLGLALLVCLLFLMVCSDSDSNSDGQYFPRPVVSPQPFQTYRLY